MSPLPKDNTWSESPPSPPPDNATGGDIRTVMGGFFVAGVCVRFKGRWYVATGGAGGWFRSGRAAAKRVSQWFCERSSLLPPPRARFASTEAHHPPPKWMEKTEIAVYPRQGKAGPPDRPAQRDWCACCLLVGNLPTDRPTVRPTVTPSDPK